MSARVDSFVHLAQITRVERAEGAEGAEEVEEVAFDKDILLKLKFYLI
jgi:hypothetical protein